MRLRFGMRAVLVATAGCGLLFAFAASWHARSLRQEEFIYEIQAAGGRVSYELVGPEWLSHVLPVRERVVLTGVTLESVRPDVIPAFIDRLAELDDLQRLDLEGCDLDEVHYATLARMTNLRELDLNGTGATRRNLEQLQTLQSLEILRLDDCCESGSDVEPLDRLSHLRELYLSGSEGNGLARLPSLRNLRVLDLAVRAVGPKSLSCLSSVPWLECLYLHGTNIRDDGVEPLAQVTQLRELDLTGTRVTAAGLNKLAQLPHLASLGLDEDVLDAQMLLALRDFPALSHLSISSQRGRPFVAFAEPTSWCQVSMGTGAPAVEFAVRASQLDACREAMKALLEARPHLVVDSEYPTPEEERRNLPGLRQILGGQPYPPLPDPPGGGQF